ncbi:hypothetical protein SESBI_10854 [Sesbania bispinosa]|nr:hypothetical protein SESBI_10854 [Sesbania bispinosa]
MGFDDGVEEENVGVLGVGEDASGVRDLVKCGANGDKVREDLVGLVEAMAEEVSVNLGDLSASAAIVKET